MKTILLALVSSICFSAPLEVKTLQTVEEFNLAIAESVRPVIVQFEASWCEPCHLLKAKFVEVAKDYDDSQLSIITIDADEHRELRRYLINNSYPTVRSYHHAEEIPRGSFLGNENIEFVRAFVNAMANKP